MSLPSSSASCFLLNNGVPRAEETLVASREEANRDDTVVEGRWRCERGEGAGEEAVEAVL